MAKLTLLPKDKKFHILLEQSALNAMRTAQQLKDMVFIWENIEQRVAIIGEMERDGDAIAHQVMTELRRTIIVQFDREDVARLANSLDDVVDFINSAAESMLSYRVEKPTDRAKELAETLVQAATGVLALVHDVFERVETGEIEKRCQVIHNLENRADATYRAAIAELFEQPTAPVNVIKWRDIYKRLETAVDKCEEIAFAVENIEAKYG